MDFFEHQAQARRLTRRFVVIFIVAVIVIILGLVLAIGLLTDIFFLEYSLAWSGSTPGLGGFLQRHLGTMTVVAVAVVLIVGGGSLWRIMSLSQGGPAVARLVGAREIHRDSSDPLELRLLNVVDEMTLAAGTLRPAVYVMDQELGINAFAAGFSPNNAVVAVTRGTLEYLNRDELQGVVAHEFSHILNGDMRLNIRLLGLLSGLILIGNLGLFLLRAVGGTRQRSAAAAFALGVTVTAIGFAGVFAAKVIRSSVSRQREYLADASAVQFTRNPDGIAGALNKIRLAPRGSSLDNLHAAEMSHLFFGAGTISRWLASHPPLEERIKRVSPAFDLTAPTNNQPPLRASESIRIPPVVPESNTVSSFSASVEGIVASAGTLTFQHLNYAQDLLAHLPEPILRALESASGVQALVYTLVLNESKTQRENQIKQIDQLGSTETARQCWDLYAVVQALGPKFRFPIIELALLELRAIPAKDFQRFATTLRELVLLDGEVEPHEMIVLLAVESNRRHAPLQQRQASTGRWADQNNAIVLVLALLAQLGEANAAARVAAFQRGLSIWRQGQVSVESPPELTLVRYIELLTAIGGLANLSPERKQHALKAFGETVLHDSQVNLHEYELLRIVAGVLACPLPPHLSLSEIETK